MKIAVAPTYYISNRAHLRFAIETIDSFRSKHDLDFIAIENHWNKEVEGKDFWEAKFHLVEKNERNNLSMGWNKGIKLGFERGADYVLVTNLDVVANEHTIDNLVDFAEAHSDGVLWTANEHDNLETIDEAEGSEGFDEHPHFSFYLVNKKLFEKVGEFDEQFEPAYNEDNDMHYRIKLLGEKAYKTDSAKFYHYGSRTIKEDMALERRNVITHGANNRKYQIKWGGAPGQEIFKSAYNK